LCYNLIVSESRIHHLSLGIYSVAELVGSKKRPPWTRVIIFALALLLVAIGATLWIVQSKGHDFWPNALSIIFVACGVVVGLLQWLFPLASSEPQPPMQQPQSTPRQPLPSPKVGPSHSTTPTKHYPYDVALSYASEDHDYAEALASELHNRNIKVFYDKYDKATLWGKNLYDHLSDLYQHKARYCVMFLSEHYAAKLWTNLERQAAQARAFQEHEEYILPVRLDDTAIPGVLPTVAYLNEPPETAETIADIIMTKLAGH
jgi:TIR domain